MIMTEVTDTHEYANATVAVFYLHLISIVSALPLDPVEYVICISSLSLCSLPLFAPSHHRPKCYSSSISIHVPIQ